jgi:aromatic-amino-acid transaminase
MTPVLALPDLSVPQDVITRANERFAADTRPDKINLGIGVYCDETGAVPLMRAVRVAERQLFDAAAPHRYLPIGGLQDFTRLVQALVLGDDSVAIAEQRAVTVQTLGGTGALSLAATFLAQADGSARVLISDPSWENHRAIFEAAGFAVATYPYYDDVAHAVNFDALLDRLAQAEAGTIVVLHGCCHNPTGMDLDLQQWDRVIDVVARRRLLPVCDLAYQGFGHGVADDRGVVDRMVARGLDVLVANSLSKSFSLYGDRIGGLTVVTHSPGQTPRVSARLQRIIRSTYSNPPTHGAAIVSRVLASPALRLVWEEELNGMRARIDDMRTRLHSRLTHLAVGQDLSFIVRQRGMFSYTGLTPDEVEVLVRNHAIHLLSTGRMCVAALNESNLERVAAAFAAVLLQRDIATRDPAH